MKNPEIVIKEKKKGYTLIFVNVFEVVKLQVHTSCEHGGQFKMTSTHFRPIILYRFDINYLFFNFSSFFIQCQLIFFTKKLGLALLKLRSGPQSGLPQCHAIKCLVSSIISFTCQFQALFLKNLGFEKTAIVRPREGAA